MKRMIAIGALALFAASCASNPQPALLAPATYSNPVLDADFPDPAIMLAPDGYHYAYATQTDRAGTMVNIQVARSRDLMKWQYLGDALPAKPTWASKTQDFWAPHVHRDRNRYLMYYSAKPDAALTDEKKGLCLAVATGTSPAGPFTDIGQPLKCGDSFVEIDPFAYDDPDTGKRLLYWGSGFRPIKVQELAPDRTAFAPGSAPVDLVSPNPTKDAFPVLIEGAWVLRRGGYYYLFYSGDNCCGAKANYAVMVARSRSATGPFETLEQATGAPHSIILARSGYWVAPGHNSIVTDARGGDWIVYHAVDARNPRGKPKDDINTRRIMLVDRIVWRDGWPTVDGPSAERKPAPQLSN
ncbi:MAG: GH43_3 / GH43 / GH43_30 / GH43_8 / GH43 _5 / GH43_31 / GH43_33 / GH43_6 / GH43_4 / GH43_9 / G H43_34 / GH43_32 / GH43_29 / GH43_10 / GH43_ 11 / GH43_13 [uncultured Sphingomonas sp.]|uniref:GH43_3 / GH43 / GH43_30 / GH43_8 / GH43 _5 / GH43_31 / GH43_33 / GH43_6 / GH43_4 / GH43_9 / G H43_34 / GH43_32 / GH43_29 / GH43_10 / GH43_ 11 / GH43_13 n=1 Tax=uncultured Sphingomonas sp. TaxID=158754 RepID=A0A6J4T0D1_9SPHN|nr:MAG: GH43_3 / GH43 / GH43_30 / GH43_8 / GH43 _5 / GH43_31 / GH43_33 / GH43_6 / GH43_4 / GH43_9 / G H43_34 / GH43_32 / GH43_29 / GH43_10 / GH43_ 11 / GH43_13 [uncultured Sphingomonas sp.]